MSHLPVSFIVPPSHFYFGEAISKLVPYYELSRHLGTHEHLGNRLDKHFRSAYTLHNPRYVEPKQFVLLYNRPTVPFQEHPKRALGIGPSEPSPIPMFLSCTQQTTSI